MIRREPGAPIRTEHEGEEAYIPLNASRARNHSLIAEAIDRLDNDEE